MLATVASVSSANRIKMRLAANYNISSHVIQTPSSLTKEGCGYSVRFDEKHKAAVIKAAREIRVNIRAFFKEETSQGEKIYIKE